MHDLAVKKLRIIQGNVKMGTPVKCARFVKIIGPELANIDEQNV